MTTQDKINALLNDERKYKGDSIQLFYPTTAWYDENDSDGYETIIMTGDEEDDEFFGTVWGLDGNDWRAIDHVDYTELCGVTYFSIQ